LPSNRTVFTGKLDVIKLPDVYVEVSAKEEVPVLVELPKQFFGSENLQIEVRLRQTQGFMAYRNGTLISRAKQRDIGIYTETASVMLNGNLATARKI
jgi:hypothetical protein